MTDYTFSVVATNSIGSGEAGVAMIITPPGMYIRTLGMGSILIYMILNVIPKKIFQYCNINNIDVVIMIIVTLISLIRNYTTNKNGGVGRGLCTGSLWGG